MQDVFVSFYLFVVVIIGSIKCEKEEIPSASGPAILVIRKRSSFGRKFIRTPTEFRNVCCSILAFSIAGLCCCTTIAAPWDAVARNTHPCMGTNVSGLSQVGFEMITFRRRQTKAQCPHRSRCCHPFNVQHDDDDGHLSGLFVAISNVGRI